MLRGKRGDGAWGYQTALGVYRRNLNFFYRFFFAVRGTFIISGMRGWAKARSGTREVMAIFSYDVARTVDPDERRYIAGCVNGVPNRKNKCKNLIHTVARELRHLRNRVASTVLFFDFNWRVRRARGRVTDPSHVITRQHFLAGVMEKYQHIRMVSHTATDQKRHGRCRWSTWPQNAGSKSRVSRDGTCF
jgi:hypothetical protein